MTGAVTTPPAPFHADPSPPRPIHRPRADQFASHVANRGERARGGDTHAGPDALDDEASRLAAQRLATRLPVAMALDAPDGQVSRLFAWGLHVNGYLSEVGAPTPGARPGVGEHSALKALPPSDPELADAHDETTSDAGGEAMRATHDGISALALTTPDLDSHGGAADQRTEQTQATICAAGWQGTDPLRKRLVRLSDHAGVSTLYLRDYRLTTDQRQALAERLRVLLAGAQAGVTRLVINGRATSRVPSTPVQGATPCPSTP
jgi:hypothetical protein